MSRAAANRVSWCIQMFAQQMHGAQSPRSESLSTGAHAGQGMSPLRTTRLRLPGRYHHHFRASGRCMALQLDGGPAKTRHREARDQDYGSLERSTDKHQSKICRHFFGRDILQPAQR